jgi:hypothetical protein
MSNNAATTVTTNILPVQALYDPTTLAFITFIGPAGLPFTSAAGAVSSVDVSGGTTGLTTTGGPIVSSGTITLGGTLSVSNGGTGATTATGAINSLLPSQATHAGKYLTTDGTNTSWSTSGANLSVVNDTSTNATRYLTFTDVNTGVITQEYVSSSKLTYNPSSGTVTATTFVGALTGNASTATSATTSNNLAGGAAGSLPYQSGSSTTTFLAAGSNGQYLTLSGGVPTWANLTYVSSFSAGTTGFTPNVSTTGAVTLSGTLAVANGGTGVTTSSGASSVVLRDANVNTSANDFYEGFTNVAAAGTTTTLTAASTPNFVVTGSGGQTYKLPDATTLPTGAIYTFNNNQTSGAITIQNNSSTTIVSVPSGGFVEIILLTNSVAAGTWDYHFQAPANVSWSTNTFSYAGSITNATWNGVSIGAIYGGTGQTSYTTGDTLYASASNTLSKLAIGSTGQVLTVSGGVPTWSNTSSATTITDDTTTNATRYINFTSATSGSLTNIGTSSTKLQYNPSTGALTSTSLTPTNALGTAYGGTNLTSFTANGVVYASSTSALATGTGLVFDGTNLSALNGSSGGQTLIVNVGNSGANYTLSRDGLTGFLKFNGNQTGYIGYEWFTGSSQAMTLTNSGYLGIGTSSPTLRLDVSGNSRVAYNSSGNTYTTVTSGSSSIQMYTDGTTNGIYSSGTSLPLTFSVNGGEVSRFDTSGNLLVGTTSVQAQEKVSIKFNGFTNQGLALVDTYATAGTTTAVNFFRNSSVVGSITTTLSGTLYNVTSDQRLKENIVDAPSASADIDAIKVRSFDFISDKSNVKYGFIAQELATVAPYAVHVPANPDEMMGVDYSKLVPMMIKEIQSLKAEVATLKGA